MEMVSAKAILYKNKNTEDLMTIHPGEHPVSLQLFGSDPEILAQIAAQIEERPFDILDFNMGCPVPKVVNNGEGSALMKDPALVRKIVTGMVKAVKKPVTVKIRKDLTKSRRMLWRLQRFSRTAVWLRLRCMEERGHSSIPEKQTGISSVR